MSDAAHRATDKRIDQLARRLNRVYNRANWELTAKVDSFFAKFEKADEKHKAMVEAGTLTEREYKQWRKGQMMMGKHYKELQKQTAEIMLNADREAARYINRELPPVVKLNYNQVGKDVESAVRGYSFELVDENTVQNLIKNHKTLLPYKEVDGKKVVRWNTRRVNAEILQGILQGESIPKIAKRLADNVTGMERDSAIRNARTAITGAENAGRMIGMQQAQEDGIIMKKEWIATNDARTREAHAELDGKQVEIDEKFVNGIGEIDFPGDPSADPANVYNCRCSLGTVVLGFKRKTEESQEKPRDEAKEAQPEYKQEQQPIEDNSFVGRLLTQKLSPYSYELDYFEYAEQMQSFEGEKTQWIEDVLPGTEIDMQSESSFDGESHCSFAPIDNTVARLYEQVPLTTDYAKLVLCDYDNAKWHLPNGEDDRRLSTDAIAQVFENEGQTVIAFRRDWMAHSLKESLQERQKLIDAGENLPMVFPVSSPEAVVMHEWGHTVHSHFLNAMCYDDPDAQGLWDWFKTLNHDDIANGLSEYATGNFGEFSAECFAEMQTSNPRPLAREYWRYMSGLLGRGY